MHKTEVSDELRCFFFILEKQFFADFKCQFKDQAMKK